MTSTAYTYDPFGNLASVTDPSGNIVTMTYDIRGHKTGENDPDKGAWSFGYDALGSVVSRKDAMVSGSNTVNFTYDLLERPLTETGFVSPTSTWIWDTSSYGVGKLAKACTNACGTADYSRTESYDLYGRPSSTAITVDGTTYTTATGYDSSGRLSTTTYPSGQVVSYTYHGDGYLAGIKNGVGGPGLWTVGQRDAYLNATQQTYGNGIVTNQGFDPAMGRVNSVSVGSSGSIRNLGYTWDLAGNLATRSDASTSSGFSVGETFGYDLLNRLTGDTVTAGSGTSKTYAFDAVGNITTKSDVGTYHYPTPGSALPHAVSSITGTVNSGAGSVSNPSYSYDADGRMLSGGGRTLTYQGFEAPQTIANPTGTATFTFDSEHQRVKQAAPEGTTVYIAAGGVLTEKFTAAGTGAVTWRSYLIAGGQAVGIYVQPVGGTAAMQYAHTDHLGSVAALTDPNGALLEQDAYDAWGKRRNPNGTADPNDTLTSLATRGYTNQEHLADVALIHMNGRVYDPQIGRFTSPDPTVPHPYSSQGWNRYAYVGNNPLNQTDPTGMAACPGPTDDNGNCYDEIVVTPPPRLPDPSAGGGSDVGFGSVALDEIVITAHRRNYQQRFIGFYGQILGPDLWGLYGDQDIGGISLIFGPEGACSNNLYATASWGFSATAASLAGLNFSLYFNLNQPVDFNWFNPLGGVQVSITVQQANLIGYGQFAGIGETRGGGLSWGIPTPEGVSSSDSYYGEADLGFGEAWGGSFQGNADGLSGAISGKMGIGLGAWLGGGKAHETKFASPRFGC